MAKKKRWVVTLTNARRTDDVTKGLVACGFDPDQVLVEIGIVTGSATDEVANRARAVSGVADVSPETQVDIGPPDAPVTW